MNTQSPDQRSKQSDIKIAQYVIVVMITSIIIILIAKFFPANHYGETYQPALVRAAETEWDPLMSSLQFGLQYFLIALLAIGIAVSLLFFFSCRDEGYSE